MRRKDLLRRGLGVVRKDSRVQENARHGLREQALHRRNVMDARSQVNVPQEGHGCPLLWGQGRRVLASQGWGCHFGDKRGCNSSRGQSLQQELVGGTHLRTRRRNTRQKLEGRRPLLGHPLLLVGRPLHHSLMMSQQQAA